MKLGVIDNIVSSRWAARTATRTPPPTTSSSTSPRPFATLSAARPRTCSNAGTRSSAT
jgi:hypothetical protein